MFSGFIVHLSISCSSSSTKMGKAQKKRAFRRHNPVRVPDSHLPKGLEAAAATSAKKNDVLPIIQKVRIVKRDESYMAYRVLCKLR